MSDIGQKSLENGLHSRYNYFFMIGSNIVITGRKRLSGTVEVSGAKNAALPELAAVVLSAEPFYFSRIPEVEDIKVMIKGLTRLGAQVEMDGGNASLQLPSIRSGLVPKQLVKTSRAPILMLGPLVARNGYAKVSLPGGCSIGDRRINFHLDGLRKMGVQIKIDNDYIFAQSSRLRGIEYTFPGKTVTGTENLLMAAMLADGETVLHNCALEPEIGDLIDLLQHMGGDIKGKGSETLLIKGQTSLAGAKHTIIPDRIEMGTYVIAGCFSGNHVIVENSNHEYIRSLLQVLKTIGIKITTKGGKIEVQGSDDLSPIDVETLPYPGFPTDLQAQLTTLLTQVEGISSIKENIFNDRFQHTRELNKLGANIQVNGDLATIRGRTELSGKEIRATDLRASAALVLGGLIAQGQTVVANAHQLFRGYESMPGKIKKLGGNIKII